MPKPKSSGYGNEMKQESGATTPRRGKAGAALDARAATRLRVLNCIRNTGEASRTDIAAALRLSPATVTFVTSGLMAGGLIEEVAQDPPDNARRGRPRVALRVARGRFHVAGIKVARQSMSVLILDFDGTQVVEKEVPLAEARMSAEGLVAAIADGVKVACTGLPGGIDSLAGVSIGLAGQIDADARFVHWSSSLTERNADLAPLLSRALPCPAFVENDANLVAKAEHLFGEARGLTNFLVVTVEYGVGLGIILDGQIFRGERGCGAEFGHTKVVLDGASCQCGQRGCLEAYVGSYALLREAHDAHVVTTPTAIDDLMTAAAGGDARAQETLDQSGQIFGMGLSNLINLFDPERIILAGANYRFDHLYTEEVMARIGRGVVNVDAPLPDIRVHQWGNIMWAKGAAAVGIEQVSALKVKEMANAGA